VTSALVSAVAHRGVSAPTAVAAVLDSLTHRKTTWFRGKQRRYVMVFATCQFVDALPLYDVKPSAWYTDVNKNYGRSSRPKGVYMFQPLNLV